MISRMRNLMFVVLATCIASHALSADSQYHADWAQGVDRVWIGPDCYATRLQDWHLRDGWAECVESAPNRPMRILHILPAWLESEHDPTRPDDFRLTVEIQPIDAEHQADSNSWAGILIGCGGPDIDYRLSALTHHRPAQDGGLAIVLNGAGRIQIRDNSTGAARGNNWSIGGALDERELAVLAADESPPPDDDQANAWSHVQLVVTGQRADNGYSLHAIATDKKTNTVLSAATIDGLDERLVEGTIGLISHLGPVDSENGYRFGNLSADGSLVQVDPERHFGPVVCTQYTISGRILKLTAQCMPLDFSEPREARLTLVSYHPGGTDTNVIHQTAPIDPDSCTVTFSLDNWDPLCEARFTVDVDPFSDDPMHFDWDWDGTIRAAPDGSKPFVLAAFTGTKHFTGNLKWNHDSIWFPHNDIVKAIEYQDPDFLFFSGDQIYEGDLTGVERRPVETAMLDYLDKWYRWCWAFGDLARDRPCICIPDDHDMFHGNIWGAGGRATRQQDDGGYLMPPRFVNMVQRTQTSHLPDPVDSEPADQGIGVYFTRIEYGGISFAVIEDRKFKSAPAPLVPDGKVVNGWFQNPDFDPATQSDVPEADLLGERQERFLEDWAVDFSHNTWAKVLLSQTIFANVATIPETASSGSVLPGLPMPAPGEYPDHYKLAADCDSNGWPQTARNRAIRAIRRGFALHIAGDQHLGSMIRYGVDDWDDAGYAFCVPSIGNAWPRRWFPPHRAANWTDGMPLNMGRYLDGFGNHMTVHAVSNPVQTGIEPTRLHNRAPGYGIIRLDRQARTMAIECWPRYSDPSFPNAMQYQGWPITIKQTDNLFAETDGALGTVRVEGLSEPVVRVIDQTSGLTEYTLRMPADPHGSLLRVKGAGPYTVEIGDPDTGIWQQRSNLVPLPGGPQGEARNIRFQF
ncbi:MAG: hypothetical protein HND57_09185 [Planctomycetes bacterium]|nr:hypothetical protein [Planctomycetota bacterium]